MLRNRCRRFRGGANWRAWTRSELRAAKGERCGKWLRAGIMFRSRNHGNNSALPLPLRPAQVGSESAFSHTRHGFAKRHSANSTGARVAQLVWPAPVTFAISVAQLRLTSEPNEARRTR